MTIIASYLFIPDSPSKVGLVAKLIFIAQLIRDGSLNEIPGALSSSRSIRIANNWLSNWDVAIAVIHLGVARLGWSRKQEPAFALWLGRTLVQRTHR